MKKWIGFLAVLAPQVLWAADIPATLHWSHRVELSTPVSGVIKSVNADVGQIVKAGQVLLSLDTGTFRARVSENLAETERTRAELAEAERELHRVQELYARTIVSTTELDQAKLKVAISRSMLSEAQARLRLTQQALADASIRAPFDAVVIIRQAEPGQNVASGLQPQMLLTLAKSGEMIARMFLSSSQAGQLKSGQQLIVRIADKDYTGNIKTLGLEPIKIKDESVYPVDVLISSKDPFRAGAPALVRLP